MGWVGIRLMISASSGFALVVVLAVWGREVSGGGSLAALQASGSSWAGRALCAASQARAPVRNKGRYMALGVLAMGVWGYGGIGV